MAQGLISLSIARSMNILIIEDDITLARHIARIFYQKISVQKVDVVTSYEDYILRINDMEIYDVVLLDLCLSNMECRPSGYRILKDIRSQNITFPIIVISGIAELNVLRRSFEIGATDYIIKPFRL
jgi:two-component system, OmpR family, response regulator